MVLKGIHVKAAKILTITSLFAISCIPVKSGLSSDIQPKQAKNVIIMIGDGMGLSQISGAMYQEKKSMSLERFKNIGIQKTSCKDKLITDSAAAAAALSRGIKANENTFGTTLDKKAPPSILEIMKTRGYATGMVVTCSLTHATPAAFVSYQLLRSMYEEIAADYLNVEIDYLIGGGKKYFDRRENDDRNLIKELEQKNVEVKSFLDGELEEITISAQKKFLYFTADTEPLPHSVGRNYLLAACQRGVPFLKKRSDKGFFLMIEGSQIDWGGHSNLGDIVIDELLEFDDVVGQMLDYAERDGETLLIVTADHETGGFSITGEDKKGAPEISFISKVHTGTMVPVFAYGPGSEQFAGIYENTEIPVKIKKALAITNETK
jgi:alkaline phosphatase